MKTLTFIAIVISALAFNSCSESCSCKKYCVLYNKDSVVVCATAMGGAGYISPAILDSLTNRYGPASDTIQTDYTTYKGLAGHVEKSASQLRQQGYYCECAK